jgi:predicted MFS family arabinose efflux permease
MPLGAVGGALLLSPVNEILGRRMAIIISIVLYTIGAALEAGSVSFGMIVGGRVILGLGVGLEGGTVSNAEDNLTIFWHKISDCNLKRYQST